MRVRCAYCTVMYTDKDRVGEREEGIYYREINRERENEWVREGGGGGDFIFSTYITQDQVISIKKI